MNLKQIRETVLSPEYGFLRDNPHLGDHIALACVAGSHAYGTQTETSDLDIRGAAMNTPEELLTYTDFEQVEDKPTDTTIFSVNKFLRLAAAGNPLFLETLGVKPEHRLIINPVGEILIENRDVFLSRRIATTFGGYANQQLRRLDNKSARTLSSAEQEAHIMNSMLHGGEIPEGFSLYLAPSEDPKMEKEIFMDVDRKHMPLREYIAGVNYLENVLRSYRKLGQRNQNAIEHGKLGKHMMHLVRLYVTGTEALETGQINTYREKEHDLLMDIRAGKYLDEESHPTKEFRDMVDELSRNFTRAIAKSPLPKEPDMAAVKKLQIRINQCILDTAKEHAPDRPIPFEGKFDAPGAENPSPTL